MKDVIIVGSGIGGLCTAIRLLNKGYKVTILEKEDTIGGKVNIKSRKGASFDLTASILMTPKIYIDIFKEVGKNYKDYFEIININPMYKVTYSDKSTYDFYSDIGKMVDILENIEEGLSIEYLDFLQKSFKKYLYSKTYFLDKPMIDIKELLNIKTMKKFIDINPYSNTNDYLKSTISNQKIIDYLIFQAMYIGINPYTNTNLYSLIPAISHIYGLPYIKGGLYQYIRALEKLIIELGGKIYTQSNVEKILIRNNKVLGVKANKRVYKSNIVISNADYTYTVNNLIKNNNKYKKINKKSYSSSVFIIYLGLSKKYDNLQLHNIHIDKNFKENIYKTFNGQLPDTPPLYLYYPSKVDNKISGEFSSILNIMVRVPNLQYKNIKWNKNTIKKFRNNIINHVKNIEGLDDIDKNIMYESYLTPIQLKYRFNAYNGAAFGLSHKLNQTTYFRPHIKDKSTNGLYFIGSSTHPGNGVSVIIEGSKVLVDVIDSDSLEKINH